MADGYVIVAPDSTGKKIQTYENTVSSQTVEAQAITLVTTAGVPITSLPTLAGVDATSTYAPSNATSTALEASHVIKGSAGVLFCINGFNNKNAAQYIQLHNASSLPGDTAVPVIVFTVPKASNFSLDFGGKFGRYFSTGIVICNSSTLATKTIGSADCWFDCQYA